MTGNYNFPCNNADRPIYDPLSFSAKIETKDSKSLISYLRANLIVSFKSSFLILLFGFVLFKNYKELKSILIFAENIRGVEINLPIKIYNQINDRFASENFSCDKRTIIIFKPSAYPETVINIPAISKFALIPCPAAAITEHENINPSEDTQIIRL
ncbi:hypothetical protein DLM76_18300 [Leptospira yasudae]|uniref:hypothetical protein n=1 Tax=Leptospira yasudae TaxID=2202201 RepID=UPI000E59B3E5|nr:hypothetical protein [Leptospira yasudae]RHX91120.1 hypothetical protein DLM76_18300 [Leptospira yasudae]